MSEDLAVSLSMLYITHDIMARESTSELCFSDAHTRGLFDAGTQTGLEAGEACM